MNVRRAAGLVALVAVLVALAPAPGAAAAPDPPRPRRVLIVTLPRVTWKTLRSVDTPNLRRFLSRAAVASMSTRTVGPRTDPAGAYLTIGAGNRADTADPATAGEAADVSDPTPTGTAGEVYTRRTGIRPDGEVVVLSIAQQIARSESLLYGAVPGALGAALTRAGHPVSVVGNADESLGDGVHREVALGAMGTNGQVRSGRVGSSLLVDDPAAPFGVRTDGAALLAAVGAGWADADVQLVEMSDLERAEQARGESTTAQGDAQFRRALLDADELFGRMLRTVDTTRDLVVVLGPTAPLSGEELTVFGMRGPGISTGWARSPTTRRDGFVTLTDVAPTVLERLGIDRPSSMNDTPADASASATPYADRVDTMVRDNERAIARDDATGPITVAFIVLLVLLLVVVAWCVTARESWARWLRWCCLLVLATPTATYLAGLLPYDPFVTTTFGLAILAIAAVLAFAAMPSARWDEMLPPVVVCVFALVVLGADILTGGWLQINTVFGYSPIVAGRFAGFGNQAFSILTISALVVVTAGWEVSRRRRPGSSDTGRIVVTVLLFGVVVVLDGAPNLGADVGGVLASVPAFAVCTLVLSGRRIRARLVALVAAATVGVLGVFALIDLSRPVESRTHLGRFAAKLLDGDAAVILERKLNANMNILTSTVWTVVIPVALVFIAYLTWRPNRMLRRINERHGSFRAFGISGLTLGVLAWAVNDSGVSIPALMLTVAIPYTAYLALQTLAAEGVPRRSVPRPDEGEPVGVEG